LSGPSSSNLNTQNQIAQQQLQVAQAEDAQSQQDKAQMQALIKPATDFYTGVTTDKQSNLAASAPQVAAITAGQKQAKEQIYNDVPAGPGRDVALAQNDTAATGAVAATKNSTYTSALDKLANIGSGLGSFSLQELGAGLSGFSGAASTNQSVIQSQQQSKASTMGLFGQLAGAAAGGAGEAIGCWIAEAIYGVDDERTHLVRAWLNGPFKQHMFGRVVMATYIKIGRTVARWVRKFAILKLTLKPLFDMALSRARRDL
jgi:hypothetical protein